MISLAKGRGLDKLAREGQDITKMYNARISQQQTDCLRKFDKKVCGAPRF